MSTTLEVTFTSGEYRVDSRLIARSLDIEHESLMRTISAYQAELEELGVFRFEIGKPPKGSRGGRPETHTLLNENQAIFLATLSRNTRQVVDAQAQTHESLCSCSPAASNCFISLTQ
jgi:phage regulator Rha-like protein